MKAWEKAQQIFREARPVVRSEEEQTWTDNVDVSKFYDDNLSLDWGSNVPGSGHLRRLWWQLFRHLRTGLSGQQGWIQVSGAGTCSTSGAGFCEAPSIISTFTKRADECQKG